MPEIEIRKKTSVPWWLWLIVFLLIAMLIWWIVAAMNNDVATQGPVYSEPASRTATTNETDTAEIMPISNIIGNVGSYIGRQVQGTAMVSSVVSDRGFWVEQNGQSLFAVIDESVGGRSEVMDINKGQRLWLQGNIYNTAEASKLPGVQNLEKETRDIINSQPAFLYVHAWNVNIKDRAS
jgi:hypothetical protein